MVFDRLCRRTVAAAEEVAVAEEADGDGDGGRGARLLPSTSSIPSVAVAFAPARPPGDGGVLDGDGDGERKMSPLGEGLLLVHVAFGA